MELNKSFSKEKIKMAKKYLKKCSAGAVGVHSFNLSAWETDLCLHCCRQVPALSSCPDFPT